MPRAPQPDLFGGPAQTDLFGPAPEPAYKPNPDHVRNRLNSLIDAARAAATMPWESTQLKLYRDIVFPQLIRLLPPEEGEELNLAFAVELKRLDAAA